jgi:hypothetical protein
MNIDIPDSVGDIVLAIVLAIGCFTVAAVFTLVVMAMRF